MADEWLKSRDVKGLVKIALAVSTRAGFELTFLSINFDLRMNPLNSFSILLKILLISKH